MAQLKIREVRTVLTQPDGIPLVVVKVLTDEPGLYGLGCATFTWRALSVASAIERYLAPLLVGRDAADIEDIWQTCMVNGYWRNGPVLNNAVSGIDMALWDLKGKAAGLPCYSLWGGKSRDSVSLYVHADGRDAEELGDHARAFMEEGYRFVRCQLGGYTGVTARTNQRGNFSGNYYDPREKLRLVPKTFERLRSTLGEEVELLYDVHERLAPVDGVWLAKALEPYRLFFLEDLLAPEDLDWFRTVRQQTATPLAMGELSAHPGEIVPLVASRLIDYLRMHLSAIGGITPCLKLSHMAEYFGVRTAWHGPADVSPVGMAANLHMDLALHNFGIQEWTVRSARSEEVFPGLPAPTDGSVRLTDRSGLGVDIDEEAAKRFPVDMERPAWFPGRGEPEPGQADPSPLWTVARLPDGTAARP